MNARLIMTSPYPQMTNIIRKVSEELRCELTIIEDTMSGAAEKISAELISKSGYEVIISRAGTAAQIAQVVDLPIIHCDNSDFDLMQAFLNARKLGKHIGFLTYPEEAFPYKMETVSQVIGFHVTQLPYTNTEDLKKQIKKAEELGIDVIVGGGRRAHKEIQKYGMKVVPILTSERIIKRTILRAQEIAKYRIIARERATRLNALISTTEEGIVFVNRQGIIEMINPAAEKMFNVSEKDVIGKSCEEITDPKLRKLLLNDYDLNEKGSITTSDMVITFQQVKVESEEEGRMFTCRAISEIQQLENRIRRESHSKGLVARSSFIDIKYSSIKMEAILKRAKVYAETESTILITGESGTGKELIAQGIHNASERAKGPFVAVNCAALPESLLESELFGYSDGAFTGAKKGGRAGVFELSHGGTIFLDEIGEISAPIQARLLRVLQEREVMRVGGDRVIPVDIRIVTATNQNLWKLVTEGRFRADLFFRINVLRLEVPPLSTRREDIPKLVDHFFQKASSSIHWETLSKKVRNFFLNYGWPGNIRQLENIVERFQLCVLESQNEDEFIDEILNETEIPGESQEVQKEDTLRIEISSMEEIEKQIYEKMLQRYNNNRTIVAEKLGVSRTTLWKKINKNMEKIE
jgi:PAS domain S-box-containing protein